jgi:ABC-type ATPase involved in cell division
VSLLSVSDLSTHYVGPGGTLRAVDEVSLNVEAGETVALVGESGCGKSTLGKTLLRLIQPTGGRIEFGGDDVTALDAKRLRAVRKRIQMIFQDPFASLNPRHTIRDILTAPLVVHKVGDKAEPARLVETMVERVGLPPDALDRYPHEFSGGTAEAEQLPAAAYYGLGVVSYSPLARGVLTGKYEPDQAPGADTRAGRGDKRILETEWRSRIVKDRQGDRRPRSCQGDRAGRFRACLGAQQSAGFRRHHRPAHRSPLG